MKSFKISAILAILLCLGVIFTGCSFIAKNAAENAVKDAASKAGVDYNQKDGSVEITTSSGSAKLGGKIEWPKNWPGDVPKLDGTLTASVDTGFGKDSGGFFMSVDVKNAKVVTDYVAKLVSQGYKKITESNDSSNYTAMLSSDKYSIVISVGSDNKASLELAPSDSSTNSSSSSDS